MTACSVDGCEKRRRSAGLCPTHHSRLLRTGTTDLRPKPPVDYVARFWAKVDQREPNECWPWLGTVTMHGYGQYVCGSGNQRTSAHRYAYTVAHGPIPDDLTIDHVYERGCRRRDCVNPAHLEAVTMAENLRRRDEANRRTHCNHGHALTADNLVPHGKDRLACRTCRRRATALSRARKSARERETCRRDEERRRTA